MYNITAVRIDPDALPSFTPVGKYYVSIKGTRQLNSNSLTIFSIDVMATFEKVI